MIRIGDKELIFSQSLLIPDGEETTMNINIMGWETEFRINFVSDSDKSKQGVKFEAVEGNVVHIRFVNWNSSLGTAITKPSKIGETNDGKIISFMANHWLIGPVRKLDLQFLLGGVV